jgi:hypothetical protein
MASPRHRRFAGAHHPARTLAVASVAALALAACATGPRPSFDADEPARQATGDPAIDAVLDRLDRVGLEYFTADYTVLTRLGGRQSTATVVQAENRRRSITINEVRFLDGSGAAATCNLVTAECEAIINDARVSDVQITHDFYGSSFARRLRVDAGRSLAPALGYTETIAGQPAVCADVPVSGGTKVYCALDSGPLARYDGNDVVIEMVASNPTPDESKFASG